MNHLLAVPGFSYSALSAGIKANSALDLALIHAPGGANTAAVFTTSEVKAAPVLLSQKHLAQSQGDISALLINSGNANAMTGEQGEKLAANSAELLSSALGLEAYNTLIASTGVIGVHPKPRAFELGIPQLVDSLNADTEALSAVSKAILTTDLVTKHYSISHEINGRSYTFTGISKGSGMICPNMATFIGIILTDAPLNAHSAQYVLNTISFSSFNAVTVDGDTSTNDTFALMASKVNEHDSEMSEKLNDFNSPEFEELLECFFEVALKISEAVARDGEGATKLLRVVVSGAESSVDAKQVAFTIAHSPLVKTAIFGCDANWGRVAAAAGRSGVPFGSNNLRIEFASILTCENGEAVAFSEEEALAALSKDEVSIHVHLGLRELHESDFDSAFTINPNEGVAGVMTCDFSYDYVRINGEYRS